MGLSWQQGPLSPTTKGTFLVPGMPVRVLYAEPLRRRMRAELGGRTVVRSDNAVLLFEPARYPAACFQRPGRRGLIQARTVGGLASRTGRTKGPSSTFDDLRLCYRLTVYSPFAPRVSFGGGVAPSAIGPCAPEPLRENCHRLSAWAFPPPSKSLPPA